MNAPLPPGAAAVAQLPMAAISPSPSNPRKHFDEAYLAELAETIKSHGVIQPITVRPVPENVLAVFKRHNRTNPAILAKPPTYEIVVGECRWRAAKLAGLDQIPAFWRELTDKEVLEIQVIENLQRRDVHPIEEAEGYEQLMTLHGYRAEEIAGKISKSRGYVYARLKLIALCQAAREAFYDSKLEASTALLIARIPGKVLQEKAVKHIISNGFGGEVMSYRNAKYYIHNNFTLSLKQATFSLIDRTLLPTAGSCADCPKRSGNAPEICADLEDADVCTDTGCFDNKRTARRDQLIANAEQRKIPFLSGSLAYEALNTDQYIDLDDTVEGDGQERTYRQILGDQAPVGALLECGHNERDKQLVEAAAPKALKRALEKAGWTPDLFKEGDKPLTESAEKRAQLDAEAAARKAKQEAAEAEGEYRKALADAVIDRVRDKGQRIFGNTDKIVALLVVAWLRFDLAFNDELDVGRLKRFGITVPVEPLSEGQDDYDDGEELEKVAAIVIEWPVGIALAFLFDVLTSEEINTKIWNFDPATDPPHTLLALAKIVDFDPESLRPTSSVAAETAPDPAPAAQAETKAAAKAALAPTETPKKPTAKKPKAKVDPAPASPANGTTKPTVSTSKTPWPFPTGASA